MTLHCDFQNSKKTIEHSDHWIMTGWYGEQWDFQTMKRQWNILIHWIMAGWHGEQWDFQSALVFVNDIENSGTFMFYKTIHSAHNDMRS